MAFLSSTPTAHDEKRVFRRRVAKASRLAKMCSASGVTVSVPLPVASVVEERDTGVWVQAWIKVEG